MNISSNPSPNHLKPVEHGTLDSSDVPANSKKAEQTSIPTAHTPGKTHQGKVITEIPATKGVNNAPASEPSTQQQQPLTDPVEKPVQTRKCQQANTLYSGSVLPARIVPSFRNTDITYKKYERMFKVLVNASDIHSLTGSPQHLCMYINEEPFTVSTSDDLERGQIVIPEIFKDDFQELDSDDKTVELTAIPKEKIPEFKAIEIIVKLKKGQLLEDADGNPLFLDLLQLRKRINSITRHGFIFDTTREYPMDFVVSSCQGISIRAKRAYPKQFMLSVRPTAYSLHAKANKIVNKEANEEANKEANKEANEDPVEKSDKAKTGYQYTLADFKKMKFFIFNSNGNKDINIIPNDQNSGILAPNMNIPELSEDFVTFQESSRMNGENILNYPFATMDDGKKKIVEIDGFYYYAGPFSPADDQVVDLGKHYVNSSFKKCHKLNKDIVTRVHPDKIFQPAKQVTIHLNWLLNDRRKVPLVGDALSQKIRNVLNDVPLQKGRYFQVLMEPDVEIYDDKGRRKVFHKGKAVIHYDFALEGTVESVEGINSGKTASDDCSLGEAFRIDDQTELTIDAQDKSILLGSEPNYLEVGPYLPILTHGLIGMEAYARRIVEGCIIPRKLYELGLRDSYTKGLILYGLPGNGKSESAHRILDSFNIPSEYKRIVIPGELLGSSPEETKNNFEKLFEKAKQEYDQKVSGQKAPLFVYLFDEFDCLFVAESKKQGRTPNQVALLGLFNNLLDSPDAPDNILCIFTTNSNPHNELASSLTRSGRISLMVKIDNPDDSARKTMVKHAVERLAPLATIDDFTLLQVANHLMSGFNSKQVIETVKVAKEQAMFLGLKQPLKLMYEHFHQALFPQNETQARKTAAMTVLRNKAFCTETNYDQEKAEFTSMLEPLTRGIGKACLYCIAANEGARVKKFLYEVLEELNGFTHYSFIDGLNPRSPELAFHELAASGTGGERKLVVITNPTEFVTLFEEEKSIEFGIAWQRVKANSNSNIALVFVAKPEHLDRNLNCLALLDEAGMPKLDDDPLILPDKFTQEQFKEYLQKTYNTADAHAIEFMIKVFPENYPMAECIRLVNFYCKNEQGVYTWDIEAIKKKLQRHKFPLNRNSMYT